MTKTGKQIVQFLYYPLLITFFILYALYFDQLKEFSLFIRNLAPSIILVLGGVLVYTNGRAEARLLSIKGELEGALTITNYDIYVIRFLELFVPIIIIMIPLLSKGDIEIIDFLQGILVFMAIQWIRVRYFRYRYEKTQDNTLRLDDTIPISYYDSMKLDLLAFGVSFLIVAIPGFITSNLKITDLFQAGAFFIVIYWINEKYFSFR